MQPQEDPVPAGGINENDAPTGSQGTNCDGAQPQMHSTPSSVDDLKEDPARHVPRGA